jgi:tripartite-type tricarboxylate transporter receptor subunit TctC
MRKATMVGAAALAAVLAFLAGPASAQEAWPSRPVTLVVPWAAGGPVDTVARIVAARIGELLGQQMVIENVGGAGGMTGTTRVAKAAPFTSVRPTTRSPISPTRRCFPTARAY